MYLAEKEDDEELANRYRSRLKDLTPNNIVLKKQKADRLRDENNYNKATRYYKDILEGYFDRLRSSIHKGAELWRQNPKEAVVQLEWQAAYRDIILECVHMMVICSSHSELIHKEADNQLYLLNICEEIRPGTLTNAYLYVYLGIITKVPSRITSPSDVITFVKPIQKFIDSDKISKHPKEPFENLGYLLLFISTLIIESCEYSYYNFQNNADISDPITGTIELLHLSIQYLERAIELSGNYRSPLIITWLARSKMLVAFYGQKEEAFAEAAALGEEAEQCFALFENQQENISLYEQNHERLDLWANLLLGYIVQPTRFFNHLTLGQSYYMLKQKQKAIEYLNRVKNMSETVSYRFDTAGFGMMMTDIDRALKEMKDL